MKTESKHTPQKQDTMRAPLSADRNKISFGIKPPKVHQSPSSDGNSNAHKESSPGSTKPRIVMQIKHGKVMTIEASPDGQRKIVSDDEEVIAKASRKEHKKFSKKSVLVPYGNESSSDSDASTRVDRAKIKKEKKEADSERIVFDTSLHATTSVPGNVHLLKTIPTHTDKTESNKPTTSVHKDKPAKNDSILNESKDNVFASPAQKKHFDSDSHKAKSEDKHEDNDKHLHAHSAGKKRKLIEGARIDVMHGEFHVVSDKVPLLSSVEKERESNEYNIVKKLKKHKKHKKDKHRNKEHKYEELVNTSSHHSEHHVKKHKKKKRKHKERDHSLDIEEEHSYRKKKHQETSDERMQKPHHHHNSDSSEERHRKRKRQESESSSSVEFEWVERTVPTPPKLSKSTSW